MKKIDEITLTALDEQLLDAVIENDASAVMQLLECGANPNCFEDRCQIRPLHFACVYNAVDVVYPLIKGGAKINMSTADGCLPVDIAIQLKHDRIVELLRQLSVNLVFWPR